MPATRNAPWPDDITCGDRIAISPTTRPPAAVRKVGRSRDRVNIASQIATPRMRMMPSIAARRPSVAASTRSWAAIVVLSGATTPSSAGEKCCATKKPISAAMPTGARLVGE